MTSGVTNMQPTPAHTVHVETVTYHPAGLQALIYRPETAGLWPAVVCVHGGAWVSGDRTATQRMATHLAACGLVVMAIDFRMGQQHPYPAALQDINLATRWLKQQGASLSVDPARVGGLGISSGGHLILLSGMRPLDMRYAALPGPVGLDARLAFVVTCSGVLDPVARYQIAQAAGYADITVCHEQYFGTLAVMDEASPPRILQRGEAVELPPAIFYQGSMDARLPPATASQMADLYLSHGGQGRAQVFEGLGHTTSEWPLSALQTVAAGMAGLIRSA